MESTSAHFRQALNARAESTLEKRLSSSSSKSSSTFFCFRRSVGDLSVDGLLRTMLSLS